MDILRQLLKKDNERNRAGEHTKSFKNLKQNHGNTVPGTL